MKHLKVLNYYQASLVELHENGNLVDMTTIRLDDNNFSRYMSSEHYRNAYSAIGAFKEDLRDDLIDRFGGANNLDECVNIIMTAASAKINDYFK